MTRVEKFCLRACVVGGLCLGLIALFIGAIQFHNSRRLAAEGKVTLGQVVDKDRKFHTRGTRYHLLVRFETDVGQAYTKRCEVGGNLFNQVSPGGQVKVHYLPSDPTVCAVGETVVTEYQILLVGVLWTGFVILFCRPAKAKDVAAVAGKIVKGEAGLAKTEYAPADARAFSHLDLRWYDSARQMLQSHGFVFVQDEEDLAFCRAEEIAGRINRMMLRFLLSRDGTTIACLYHCKPRWRAALRGAKSSRLLSLQTQFSNGCWVWTSNAGGASGSPPAIDTLHLPVQTSIETLVDTHTQRVSRFLDNHPGVQPVRLRSIGDIHQALKAQGQMQSEYVRKTGYTKEEVKSILGVGTSSINVDRIYAEYEKLREERKRAAA